MPDSAQVQSAVDAAEQAATAGDFNAAARHLHDALALQERELGPTHPDLASTLNNLGVVTERTGDFAEAERCYRRACEIVAAAFPAEHPFVETSRRNLEAFCEARAVPVQPPPKFVSEPPRPAAPVVARPTVAAPAVSVPAPQRASPAAPPPRIAPPAVEQTPGRFALLPVVAAAGVVLALVLWVSRGPRTETNASTPVPGVTPAAATSTPAAASAPTSAPAPPAPAAAATRTPAPPAVAPPAAVRTPAPAGSPSVVEAQLCRALTRGAEWTCARPSDPASPGHMYFYTRVTTARDTTIVHRWYRNDRVQLTRELPIEANLGAGYRTYSHLVLDAGSAGQWRVELRTADGRVLREERFVVR